MIEPFDTISENSRLWIYQAERPLNENEVAFIHKSLKKFLTQWAAHGAPLQAAYKVAYDQFIIIAVDEGYNEASGCSIDASVHAMQEIANALQIDFFDRKNVAFLDGDKVFVESLNTIKEKVESGVITEDTKTFNNLVKSKKEMKEGWIVDAKDTWLSRYFKKSVHNI